MDILDPRKMKNEKDQGIEEQRERIRKLNVEEVQATKRVSDAHEREKKEIDLIEGNLAGARTRHKTEVARMSGEVAALERQKETALEPLKEKERQIIRDNEALGRREKATTEREIFLEKTIDEYSQARDSYEVRQKELDEKEENLLARELKLSEDKNDFDRHMNARESVLHDEKQRLRTYFEAEDDKLKLKSKQI